MMARCLKAIATSSMDASYASKAKYRREKSTTCTEIGRTDMGAKAKRNSATHQA